MKKLGFLLTAVFFLLRLSAQQQLHIHHINIEDGDATLIGIYDTQTGQYTSKILIDGGFSTSTARLLPYIKKMVGDDAASYHFEYIILTHYHNDHYNGLTAIKTGKLTADSIVDPGGYPVDSLFHHTGDSGTKPAKMKRALDWLRALETAADHTPDPYVKGRSKILLRFDATSGSSIGNSLILGTVGSQTVFLDCIAGWGNTLSDTGIQPNPSPTRDNANNYTLAFILRCGEFRYFIGGDMGGDTHSPYIDQETTVTKYLQDAYPVSFSWTGTTSVKGHVCGFKANHHGSEHSNTSGFMNGMFPAITVTSAGNDDGWHLPSLPYLTRLAQVKPLSFPASTHDSIFNRGVYFTNLYDFTAGNISKTKANNLFRSKAGISYNYGNTYSAHAGYLIKVTENDLANKSSFEVGRVDISKTIPYKRLGYFLCHKASE